MGQPTLSSHKQVDLLLHRGPRGSHTGESMHSPARHPFAANKCQSQSPHLLGLHWQLIPCEATSDASRSSLLCKGEATPESDLRSWTVKCPTGTPCSTASRTQCGPSSTAGAQARPIAQAPVLARQNPVHRLIRTHEPQNQTFRILFARKQCPVTTQILPGEYLLVDMFVYTHTHPEVTHFTIQCR